MRRRLPLLIAKEFFIFKKKMFSQLSSFYHDSILMFFKSLRIAIKDQILDQVQRIHYSNHGEMETQFLISYYLVMASVVVGSFLLSKACRKMSVYILFVLIINACTDLMIWALNLKILSEELLLLDKTTFLSILLIVRYVVGFYTVSIIVTSITFRKYLNDE